jgi:hypothetical protein
VKTRDGYRKSGMEPWFEFWAAVRDSVKQFAKEWRKVQAYRRNQTAGHCPRHWVFFE